MIPQIKKSADGKPMIYRNTEMKLDALIGYLKDGKINLVPAFQRGHVWKLDDRKKLISNVILGRPFPSIFLYRDADGKRYTYNILDGKQRIESIILYIGEGSGDLGIPNWADYFFSNTVKRSVGYPVDLPTAKKRKFVELDDASIRDLREYSIPIIEITLSDNTEVDEIIDLLVDINQRGEQVKRFEIVRAMNQENKLLQSVFNLIATKHELKKDLTYKQRQTEFNFVLSRLSVIANATEVSAKVDRTWERLLELALFTRTKVHVKPVEVLKRFIKVRTPEPKLKAVELTTLRKVFRFLRKAYHPNIVKMRLATDQTHFYTMVTALISSDLMAKFGDADLITKLNTFAKLIEDTAAPSADKKIAKDIKDYLEVSSKQTTDVSRRTTRQNSFVRIIEAL